MLRRELDHPIQDVCFIGTEIIGSCRKAETIRPDVCCQLDSGETVNIEDQVVKNRNMLERPIYYASSLIVNKPTWVRKPQAFPILDQAVAPIVEVTHQPD